MCIFRGNCHNDSNNKLTSINMIQLTGSMTKSVTQALQCTDTGKKNEKKVQQNKTNKL